MRSDQRFPVALQNCPVTLSITSTTDNRYIDINKTFERFTGYTREKIIGKTPSDLSTWADYSQRVALINRLRRERSMQDVEARFRRRNGQIWIGLSSLQLIEIDEEPCVLIATADITENKLAEAHSKLTQKLIQAQEEERARVSWELHRHIDDLILVSIVLDRPSRENLDFETEIPLEAKQQLKDVVTRLLDLSHRLYPAKLEYLGLAAAAASFCKELSEAQKMRIDFHSANVPTELPHDISLCLYRVLQEALQNAIKYSGSRELEVSLIREANEIHLRVRACGVGFDTTVASKIGFGLLSVEQRLKLVDGECSIESQPQRGTTINARVPMKERGKSKAVT